MQIFVDNQRLRTFVVSVFGSIEVDSGRTNVDLQTAKHVINDVYQSLVLICLLFTVCYCFLFEISL